jgi:hypothetical protein
MLKIKGITRNSSEKKEFKMGNITAIEKEMLKDSNV